VSALATAFMAAALLGWMRFMASHSAALITLGGVAVGGAVYALFLVVFRTPEVGSVFRLVKRRLSR
jgi:hypothetical protein